MRLVLAKARGRYAQVKGGQEQIPTAGRCRAQRAESIMMQHIAPNLDDLLLVEQKALGFGNFGAGLCRVCVFAPQ